MPMTLTPLTRRRLALFRANRRGYWSTWILGGLLGISLFAEVIANDRPLLIRFDDRWYVPVLYDYPETEFGGFLETTADYTDAAVVELIEERGWLLWPPIPYRYDTHILDLPQPAPSPPTRHNWLGTDDQARDVLARLIYGFRVSLLFALTLTFFSTVIGVAAGAVQGYFGGWVDLALQRFIEIWSGLPRLYLLIILASVVTPNFWWLLGLLLLFHWMALVGVVRAEFLRARNFDYVRAARALGVSNPRIMARHILPNAMVATLTFLPFVTSGALVTLTALDFLGFGMPPGSASLGELLRQGKDNLEAPWLGFTGFAVVAVLLSLLVFIGEAVRDAFDPRKALAAEDSSGDAVSPGLAATADASADADDTLLRIDDLHVRFGRGEHAVEAVRGVSFSIRRGETVALVGESGSGKSVTALSILRLLPYPHASHPRGRIFFQGEDLLQLPETQLRRVRGDRIAVVFQEPMTSLNPLHTIERQVGEVLQLHRGLDAAAARARTLELLADVGIEDPERRLPSYPHELSGGQRQRVMIAMALANDPDLLIADEPTTAVDVTIQAQLLSLLQRLQRERGMALLFITHDLHLVRTIASRVHVMCAGHIVEGGDTQAVLTHPRHPYTQALLAAQPREHPPAIAAAAPDLLRVDDLRVWFPIRRGVLRRTVDHIKAVDGVSLTVRRGETIGIVGESGSGKTTLGLAVLRLLASSGTIQFDGRDLRQVAGDAMLRLRRDMQIVFQDPFASLSPRLSIGQIIAEGLEVHGIGDATEREQRVAQILREVGLDPEARHRYPHEFSGGQRQRVAIARAMVLDPRLVILDEPTSALDLSVQAQIIDLLVELQRKHEVAYLFISHDLRVVRAMSHHLVVMHRGCVVEQGEAASVFSAPRHPYTQSLLAAAFAFQTVGNRPSKS